MTNIQELAMKVDGILLVLDGVEVHMSTLGFTRTVRFFTKESAIEFILTFDLVKFQNSGNF